MRINSVYAAASRSWGLGRGWTVRPSLGARALNHSVFADEFAVVNYFEITSITFFDGNVEVVGPKLDHDFGQLAACVHLPEQGRLPERGNDAVRIKPVK